MDKKIKPFRFDISVYIGTKEIDDDTLTKVCIADKSAARIINDAAKRMIRQNTETGETA